MPQRTLPQRTLLCVLTALLVLAVVPAGAEAGVTATATRDGGSADVSGIATFVPNEGPFDIGGAVTGFADAGAADALGINLTKGEVEVLEDGVRFIWHLTALDQVPPEGIRYTWSFGAGDQTYQLQAKTSNLASVTTTEDPVGHAQQAASGDGWFQLRGACEEQYRGLAISGCYHLAFLDGAFDADADTVEMFMPFNTTDQIGRVVGEGFQRGAEITEVQTAGASLTAAGQAVASTTATGSFLNGWGSFFAGETVQGFVGRAGQAAPTFGQEWTTLDLDEDGTFSGSLDGVSTTNDTVHLRACNLRTCTSTSIPLG